MIIKVETSNPNQLHDELIENNVNPVFYHIDEKGVSHITFEKNADLEKCNLVIANHVPREIAIISEEEYLEQRLADIELMLAEIISI